MRGRCALGDTRLAVSSLDRVIFPGSGLTKADLFGYYATLAEAILPWTADRPLVLERFPDGVGGESFYQQTTPETVPDGVRVEAVAAGGRRRRPRLVGGDLATLLYTIQLGAVSYDPWHTRLTQPECADYTILDLDPGPETDFRRVVDVAHRVKEELDALGLRGALKTSGATGLHVYLPLPPGTPAEAALLVAQILATRVAQKHPREATVERLTRRRPSGTVYVDYLQNIPGKTVAGVYAARARPGATVSTPLGWAELDDDLDPRAHDLTTVPERLRRLGDLWSTAMAAENPLEALLPGRGR